VIARILIATIVVIIPIAVGGILLLTVALAIEIAKLVRGK
jgi:hypothetical protein